MTKKPPKLTGRRASEILASLADDQRPLAFTADEIEEIMGSGLAIEADPEDFARAQQLAPVVRALAQTELDDPAAPDKVAAAIAVLDGKLKSDWHRFTTSEDKLRKLEHERALLRRALAYLRDPAMRAPLVGIVIGTRSVPPTARYRACDTLGEELYAITHRGADVSWQLALRLQRFADAPLAAFLASYDKVTKKMQALSGQVETLSTNVGFVRKNPHQVVIGLVKSGLPPDQALATYHSAAAVGSDAAVTVVRNGGSPEVLARLRAAERLLIQYGLGPTQILAGAAKTLLAYPDMLVGAQRFALLAQLLEQHDIPQNAYVVKLAARLMPAAGEPKDIVDRVRSAFDKLVATQAEAPVPSFIPPLAVALAAMVKSPTEIQTLVPRFREIERELVRAKLSWDRNAADHALECVACAGTPLEVVAVVRSLTVEVARGRPVDQSHVAIAASFAKRFAF